MSEKVKETKVKKEKIVLSDNEKIYLSKGKAIKEFIVIISLCQKWIDNYVKTTMPQNEINAHLNDEAINGVLEYYKENRLLFYKSERTLFCENVEMKGSLLFLGNIDVEKENAWLEQKMPDESINYDGIDPIYKCFCLKKHLYIIQLLQDEVFINQLYSSAEENARSIEQCYKDLYISDLEFVVENLKAINEIINNPLNKVKTEVRFWHKYILIKSEELLKTITETGKKSVSIPDRVFILNKLFEVIEIEPAKTDNKKKFLAAIIGTTEGEITDALSSLSTEDSKLSDKRKKKAIEMFNYLKGKANSNKVEPKGNEIIKKIEERIFSNNIK